MPSQELGPEWVILRYLPPTSPDNKHNYQRALVAAARRVWPYAQAHAQRELPRVRSDPESDMLATEVWEGALRSLARSFHRGKASSGDIGNLDSYLIGTFRHRFSRACRRQKRREKTILLVASAPELDAIAQKQGLHASLDLDQRVLAQEVIARMDRWLRRVWTAQQYGYSWKEIAQHTGLAEQCAKSRFKYRLSRLRLRLGGGS